MKHLSDLFLAHSGKEKATERGYVAPKMLASILHTGLGSLPCGHMFLCCLRAGALSLALGVLVPLITPASLSESSPWPQEGMWMGEGCPQVNVLKREAGIEDSGALTWRKCCCSAYMPR